MSRKWRDIICPRCVAESGLAHRHNVDAVHQLHIGGAPCDENLLSLLLFLFSFSPAQAVVQRRRAVLAQGHRSRRRRSAASSDVNADDLEDDDQRMGVSAAHSLST